MDLQSQLCLDSSERGVFLCYNYCMDYLKQVVLKDKLITEPTLVEFIGGCFRETGGIKGVHEDLAGVGYGKLSEAAYDYLDEAKKSGSLNLKSLTSHELRIFCLSIVATLQDYHDLDALMMLDFDRAMALIREI